MEVGWNAASWSALEPDPGQTGWYGTPSKSTSVPKQPPTLTRVDWNGGMKGGAKQPTSSSSPKNVASVSCTPSWMQFPPWPSTALQYSKCPISKCPISSEKAMLYECAAHT